MDSTAEIFQECKNIVFDDCYCYAKRWKQEDPKRVLVGIIPNYIPREIIHAANGLAVGIIGSEYRNHKDFLGLGIGDQGSVNSDPQSPIPNPRRGYSNDHPAMTCSMLGGVFELVRSGNHTDFDGFILPSQCHELKSVEEIIEINKSCKFIKYINFPQYFQTIIGDIINHYFVHALLEEIYKINGVKVTKEMFDNSIKLYRNNLSLTEKIYSIRQNYPDKISQDELYILVFAGLLIPIEKHNEFLNKIIDLMQEDIKDANDVIFKSFSGAFC